jgi:hypothetical protein
MKIKITAMTKTLYFPVFAIINPDPREPTDAPTDCGIRRIPASVVVHPLT